MNWIDLISPTGAIRVNSRSAISVLVNVLVKSFP